MNPNNVLGRMEQVISDFQRVRSEIEGGTQIGGLRSRKVIHISHCYQQAY